MNIYFFIKWTKAFSPKKNYYWFALSLVIVMVFAPMITRLIQKFPFVLFKRGFAYISFSWMGFIMLFFVISGLWDIGTWISSFFIRNNIGCSFSQERLFLINLIVVLLIIVYGHIEARNIVIKEVQIPAYGKTALKERIRVAQISDVHLSIIDDKVRLKRIVDLLLQIKPDVIVSTGDLYDGHLENLETCVSLLSSLKPRFGKFAVIGNHEVYGGLNDALNFHYRCNFAVLRQNAVVLPVGINIVGVDDPTVFTKSLENQHDEVVLLKSLPKENFTIFLKHRPEVNQSSIGFFDLQLSGHTHYGQIFPFRVITGLVNSFNYGLHKLKFGYIFVSAGTGTWGPPFRFLTPPEITVFEIIPSNDEYKL